MIGRRSQESSCLGFGAGETGRCVRTGRVGQLEVGGSHELSEDFPLLTDSLGSEPLFAGAQPGWKAVMSAYS